MMRLQSPILAIFFLFTTIISCSHNSGVQSPNPEDSIKLKPGDKLGTCYPLDSIKELYVNNWTGKHLLVGKQRNEVIKVFKNAKFVQTGAQIKPGHLSFTFVFNNGNSDGCYGTNGILVFDESFFRELNHTDAEFHLDKEFNFENF